MPLTILYDEYIGRPKLTEQKKTSWVYNSSLPTKVGVKTIKTYQTLFKYSDKFFILQVDITVKGDKIIDLALNSKPLFAKASIKGWTLLANWFYIYCRNFSDAKVPH